MHTHFKYLPANHIVVVLPTKMLSEPSVILCTDAMGFLSSFSTTDLYIRVMLFSPRSGMHVFLRIKLRVA